MFERTQIDIGNKAVKALEQRFAFRAAGSGRSGGVFRERGKQTRGS